MSTEYRLAVERPAGVEGERYRYYIHRTYKDARDGLTAHADWSVEQPKEWPAWIESREVTVWERVDYLPVEGVPV
jgi:hypothetical protein